MGFSGHRRRFLPLVCTVLISLGCLGNGQGLAEISILYDGFGAADGFDRATSARFGKAGPLLPSTTELAVPFAVPSSRNQYLHGLDLAITGGVGASQVELRLLGDDPTSTPDGVPDESLLLYRVVVPVTADDRAGPPGPQSIVRVRPPRGPLLQAGTRYWVAVSAPAPAPRGTLHRWWGAAPQARPIARTLGRRRDLGPWRIATAHESGLALRVSAVPIPDRRPAAYTFTKIADTHGPFRRFPEPGFVSLNDAGTVVFHAELKRGPHGLFTASGEGSLASVAKSGPFAPFSRVDPVSSLNAAGVVVWRGALHGGSSGLFKGTGHDVTPLLYEDGPLHSFGPPSVSATGAVAFAAGLRGQGGGIFTTRGDGALTAIAHTSGLFSGFLDRPSINADGSVAFGARRESGDWGIYVQRGQARIRIAETTGPLTALRAPSLNDRGTVAFVGCFGVPAPGCAPAPGVQQGLFLGNGGPLIPLVDSRGRFETFGDPVLNNAGEVAFVASLDSGRRGLYCATNARIHAVIATGARLLGSMVVDLGFWNQVGLNDRGQIAFYARLEDGTEGLYLATPRDPS